jgi:hypothetical protein
MTPLAARLNVLLLLMAAHLSFHTSVNTAARYQQPSKSLHENETLAAGASAAQPSIYSPFSRMLANSLIGSGPQLILPRMHIESHKALLGETIRLECPQPNPTWFFRRVSLDSSGSNSKYFSGASSSSANKNAAEDIIVTRHGIINADYKYKIMCHMTLKHKVIIVSNIDMDDEGLYTCLYTMPVGSVDGGEAGVQADGSVNNLAQYRYVFNVTVYSTSIFCFSFLFPYCLLEFFHNCFLVIYCSAHKRA